MATWTRSYQKIVYGCDFEEIDGALDLGEESLECVGAAPAGPLGGGARESVRGRGAFCDAVVETNAGLLFGGDIGVGDGHRGAERGDVVEDVIMGWGGDREEVEEVGEEAAHAQAGEKKGGGGLALGVVKEGGGDGGQRRIGGVGEQKVGHVGAKVFFAKDASGRGEG